jgi:hypothetical protein
LPVHVPTFAAALHVTRLAGSAALKHPCCCNPLLRPVQLGAPACSCIMHGPNKL